MVGFSLGTGTKTSNSLIVIVLVVVLVLDLRAQRWASRYGHETTGQGTSRALGQVSRTTTRTRTITNARHLLAPFPSDDAGTYFSTNAFNLARASSHCSETRSR